MLRKLMEGYKMNDLAKRLLDYESDGLDACATLQLFADLISTGWAWKLLDHYGRIADGLIRVGWITPNGGITESGWGSCTPFQEGSYER